MKQVVAAALERFERFEGFLGGGNTGLSRIETPLSSPHGGRGGNGVQSAFTLVNKVEKDFK